MIADMHHTCMIHGMLYMEIVVTQTILTTYFRSTTVAAKLSFNISKHIILFTRVFSYTLQFCSFLTFTLFMIFFLTTSHCLLVQCIFVPHSESS